MSRYIDFDYVKSKKRLDLKSMHHSVWMQDIYSAPSIDLVRCKECKHWVSDGGAIMFCEHTDVPTDANDYCSWGEREGE